MAMYLGSKKVAVTNTLEKQVPSMKAFFEAGGKCSKSTATSFDVIIKYDDTSNVTDMQGMFSGCTSLTTAPELPATTLAVNCYAFMFDGCTKLNYVKALFISYTSLKNYLKNWLRNVSATGTFVKNKDATWTNTDAGIPSGWTVQTA